ncbi:PPE domain-containing protein [Mycobacterium szulgai]|nr:PPE domain-containing protein [Mycobacterium szulgai]
MTVPPSLISANRSLVMSLIESNTFGQNSPAIATAEAVYDRMWTQDVDAMYCYAGNSGAAARLSSFRSPPANTNLGSSAGQLSTAQQAAANNYAALTELTAALPGALQQLASPRLRRRRICRG